MEPTWAVLGLSWAPEGPSWCPLGPSWGPLGALSGPLGGLLGPLKSLQERFQDDVKNETPSRAKKRQKHNVFQ